jgi:hypothetical protein
MLREWGYLVLVEWQVGIREVEFNCEENQMVLRREENVGGGPCLTALTDFASSDSSMTASSGAEGTISCGESTVVAILFFKSFFGGERSGWYQAPDGVMSSA